MNQKSNRWAIGLAVATLVVAGLTFTPQADARGFGAAKSGAVMPDSSSGPERVASPPESRVAAPVSTFGSWWARTSDHRSAASSEEPKIEESEPIFFMSVMSRFSMFNWFFNYFT